MHLSEELLLEELEFSQVAIRRNFDNRVPELKVPNIRILVNSLLQPVQKRLGSRLIITSGYRCARLNREMAGSRNSAHMLGLAADIRVPGMSPYEVTECVAESDLPYDVVMHEFGRWTHVQAARPSETPRRLVMTSHKLGNNHTRVSEGNLPVDDSRQLE